MGGKLLGQHRKTQYAVGAHHAEDEPECPRRRDPFADNGQLHQHEQRGPDAKNDDGRNTALAHPYSNGPNENIADNETNGPG